MEGADPVPKAGEDVVELFGRNEGNDDPEGAILVEAVDMLAEGVNVVNALGFPKEVAEEGQFG